MKQKIKEKTEKRSTELAILIITIAVVGTAAQTTDTNILDAGASSSNGLVAEYRFDTGTGDTAYDTAGDNNVAINGASWTEGVEGKALRFDGSDDYLASEYSVAGSDAYPEGLTVSSWVYREDGGTGSRTRIVSTDASEYWSLDQDSGTGNGDNSVSAYVNVDGSTYFLDSQDSLPLNRWSHIVLTWDPETEQMKLYRDGEEVASRATGINLGSGTTRYLTIGDGSEAGSFDGDRNKAYFGGKVDSIRIYEEDLSLSQIRSLYNSGSWRIGTTTEKDDPDKVLDMSFQHQTASQVLDTSGYKNHGQPQNGASQEDAVNCKVGRCYSFDGSDDEVEISSNVLSSGSDATFMGWYYLHGRGDTSWNRLLDIQDGSNNDGFGFVWDEDDDRYGVFSPNAGYTAITGEDPPLNEWHHWSGVIDSSNSQVKFYIDGKLVESSSASESWNQQVVEIGGRYDKNYDNINGLADNIKVFNRSLTQQEIIKKTQGLESDGAVLDMRFDSDGGDHVEDRSMEENHGTLEYSESTGPERIDGLNGNALKFDGKDDFVKIPDQSSLDLIEQVTISGWFKSDQSNYRYITLSKGSGDFPTDSYSLDIERGNAEARFGNGTRVTEVNAGADLTEWSHVVATFDTEEANLFIDGEKVDSSETGFELSETNLPLHLGARPDFKGSVQFFSGSMENIKIYPYKLSSARIKEIYNRNKQNLGSNTEEENTNLQEDLILSQTFDRVETCGQSDTLSCPSGVSGEVAVDESGKANHGELMNGPSVKGAEDCRVGGCLGFDAKDDTVRVDRDSSIVSGSRSISFWVNLNGELSQGSWENIVGQGSMRVEVNEADTTTLNWYTTGGEGSFSVLNNEWVHVTVTANSDTAKMYTDGNLVGSFSVDTLNEPSGDLWIMSEESFKYVGGKIDQVRIYNRSLSNQEVWNLYTNGRDKETGMAGPMGWWRMDSINGGSTPDLAEGNDGAVSGANLVSGKVGKALEFDGSDDGVNVGNPSMDLTRSLSICLWIKPDDMSAQRENPIDKAYGGEFSFTLEDSSQGVLSTYFGSAGDNAKPYATNRWSNVFQNDKWSHICWVRNNSAQDAKLYKNGADWSSYQTSSEWETPSQSSDSIQIGNGYTNSFDGSLDDVRIYPYALNKEQVKQVMNSGAVSVG